jgi:hypothetical protein
MQGLYNFLRIPDGFDAEFVLYSLCFRLLIFFLIVFISLDTLKWFINKILTIGMGGKR